MAPLRLIVLISSLMVILINCNQADLQVEKKTTYAVDTEYHVRMKEIRNELRKPFVPMRLFVEHYNYSKDLGCLYFHRQPRTFNESMEFCATLGAEPVIIRNERLNTNVSDIVNNLNISIWLPSVAMNRKQDFMWLSDESPPMYAPFRSNYKEKIRCSRNGTSLETRNAKTPKYRTVLTTFDMSTYRGYWQMWCDYELAASICKVPIDEPDCDYIAQFLKKHSVAVQEQEKLFKEFGARVKLDILKRYTRAIVVTVAITCFTWGFFALMFWKMKKKTKQKPEMAGIEMEPLKKERKKVSIEAEESVEDDAEVNVSK